MKKRLFIFFVMAVYDVVASAECDSINGPSGARDCVSHRNDGRKQWANCLSNEFIKQTSGGRHKCKLMHSKYCWYTCMAELHNTFSSPVTDDCACDGKQTFEGDTLPSKCYSPDGSDCSWYSDCLEQKHRCSETSHSYAIEYAHKYCNLYGDKSKSFSEQGQRWINAVRKCLQAALVPTIRQYYKGDCADIKKKAFQSHDECYLKPGSGEPSICDLNPSDWAKTFWTVKGSVLSKDWYRSLWGMAKIGGTCGGSAIYDGLRVMALNDPMKSLAFKMISSTRRENISRDKRNAGGNNQDENLDRKWDVASKTTKAIATKMQWENNSLDLFGFVADNDADFSNVTVNVWLRSSVNSSLSVQVSKVEDWIKSGQDQLTVNVYGLEYKLESMSSCEDNVCRSVLRTTGFGENLQSSSV